MGDQRLASKRGQSIVQLAGGLVGPDIEHLDMKHGSAIEPCRHCHQAHAGLRVAGENRRLDGCGAAPARQDRCVNVETAVLRDVENCLRQYQAVRRHDQHIGLEVGQLSGRLLIAQRHRLLHGNALFDGVLLDRACRQLLAAAGRPVRLGEHGYRIAPAFHQRRQRSQRKVRRAGENDPGHIATAE